VSSPTSYSRPSVPSPWATVAGAPCLTAMTRSLQASSPDSAVTS
jgi:hypothetical protein